MGLISDYMGAVVPMYRHRAVRPRKPLPPLALRPWAPTAIVRYEAPVLRREVMPLPWWRRAVRLVWR